MTVAIAYLATQPARDEIDALAGLALLVFGAPWCPHCQAAEAPLAAALAERADIRLLAFEDGPGRPLGRSFEVKRWPTLILLRDGQELGRQVRPTQVKEIRELLALAPG